MKNQRDFAVIEKVELGMKIDILGVTYEVLESTHPRAMTSVDCIVWRALRERTEQSQT